MQPSKRSIARVARWVVALCVLSLAVLTAAALRSRTYLWDAIIIARKASGQLTDVSWHDLGQIIRPASGFELRHLARWGNPYRTLVNPYTSDADLEQGRSLFTSICAKCHGRSAQGGAGPALIGHPLHHGSSDWALYRTITRGIPGTPMQGGFVSGKQVWRVIAYLDHLAESPPPAAGEAPTGTAGGGVPSSLRPPLDVTQDELRESPDDGQWLLPAGSYAGRRYSPDAQIDTSNVARLSVRWIHQFPSSDTPNESSPIVAGNDLFVTIPGGTVVALDARSGSQIWEYTRPVPGDVQLCCLAANRGVAVLGNRVYVATLDAHLIALDATTGHPVWDQTVADYRHGYSITSAPLPIDDFIVTGIAGGDYATRGFLSAYDAASGHLRWRFYTVQQPQGNVHESWAGSSWQNGGAATWGIGSYDPQSGLLYWGVGNPAPVYSDAARSGDDLYSNSLIALHAATGKLAWDFQFSPGDDHDWDSIQTPALFDLAAGGSPQKLLAVANRNGFFYVLDRLTGRFVRGAPYVRETWALGLTPSGRPILSQNSHPSPQGTYLFPSVLGGTNWWPSAYSPQAGLYFVNATEDGGLFFLGDSSQEPRRGRLYTDGWMRFDDRKPGTDLVRAIDPVTATVKWERHNSTVTLAPRGGLLATAGGLLFGSDGSRLYALDAETGKELWSFDAGGHISAPPMTYTADGRQIIAVVAGQDLITFALGMP